MANTKLILHTLLVILAALEQPISVSAAYHPSRSPNKHNPSSVIFPLTGNVYPKGYVCVCVYYVYIVMFHMLFILDSVLVYQFIHDRGLLILYMPTNFIFLGF